MKYALLGLVCCLLFNQRIVAQETVTGRVTDASSGEPLAGATIVAVDEGFSTTTNEEGRYAITVRSLRGSLSVSYIGYEGQELALEGRTTLNISLVASDSALEEVVVVGYGTVKKSDLTGTVSSVKVDDLSQGVVSATDQLLIGKASGVNVVQGDGEPGAGFSINIRGSASITASNEPLYVIDGVPLDNDREIAQNGIGVGNTRTPRNPLASLNPGDIASIEVLKDASAAAIYGSRGANGVILITTKSGKSGRAKFDYSGYVGTQNWHNKLALLNGPDYRRVLNEIIDAGGADPSFRIPDDISNTDWQDAIANPNAMAFNQQLSLSGGSERTTYYISANYLDQNGIIRNSSYKRYSGRVNLESKVTDKMLVGVRMTSSYSIDDFIPNGAASIEDAGALQAAYTYDPTMRIKDDNGVFLRNELISVDNPVALIEGIKSQSLTNRTLIAAFAQYNFNSDLFMRVNFARDFSFESRKSFASDVTRLGEQNNGIGSNQNADMNHVLFDGILNYQKSFGIHRIDLMGGASFERFVNNYLINRSSDFPSLTVGAENLGLGKRDNYSLSNRKTGNRLASSLGRINYTLLEKYLFTFTARYDGSSRFGRNNKYGFFPSGAFAWKLDEERFFENMDALDNLKLRVSWGRTGNQEIGNYPSLSTYSQGQAAILDNVATTTTTPTRIPNPDLRWETTEQTNVGADFSFWKGVIEGNVDFFVKNTKDLLLDLPISSSSGFRTRLSNVGEVRNTGLEISLNTSNINNLNFRWNSNFNFSSLKNKVLNLGSIPEIIVGGAPTWGGGVAIIKPGETLNAFIGWKVEGIWQEYDDFSQTTDNVKPGDIKFADLNNDGTINDVDRQILGNSFPDFQFSLANTFNYKGVELFIFMDAQTGVEMLNTKMVESYYPINFGRNKFAEPYLNRWTPQNPTNKYPSFVNPTNQGVRSVNSYTVEDASYLKFRTIRLSYDVSDLLRVFDAAQVYLTGENLFTISNYSGIDPAVNSNGTANYRIDLNSYPTARSFLIGFRFNF